VLLLTPQKVRETFRKTTVAEGLWSFISRCTPDYPCPPFVIAFAALKYQAQGIHVDTVGFDRDALLVITNTTCFCNRDVRVDFDQARKLATIGRSLLEIHERMSDLKVNGALVLDERKIRSIQWLIYVVEYEL
jgi:hypothetical protein